MQFIGGLLADAGNLPAEPVLLWRELDRSVKHVVIGTGLTVGRKTLVPGLAFSTDAFLSRSHFRVCPEGDSYRIEDLRSKNGTYINCAENQVSSKALRDGDIILAGNHVFVFLDPRKTT
jgi:pSer/pThr/pTyr-binding forkhead associated (FHA) protein